MDLVASGISQALVTTQAGLLIAIPALAFTHLLNRRKMTGFDASVEWRAFQ